MTENKYHFFLNGPFCQWEDSPMKIDSIQFGCAEQYMMFMKAATFEDWEVAARIMMTDRPYEQKQLGRMVRGFDETTWNGGGEDSLAWMIVQKASRAKFEQNEDLLDDLEYTIGQELVEASPVDPIWGIGLDEWDPRRFDKNLWEGTNWLGRILTQTRIEMIGS